MPDRFGPLFENAVYHSFTGCYDRCAVSAELRKLIRDAIWMIMAVSLFFDAALADYAISPVWCIFFSDEDGHWTSPKPPPEAWIVVLGFILLQGGLIFALIRLRSVTGATDSCLRVTPHQ
jgi:hypothetical protein